MPVPANPEFCTVSDVKDLLGLAADDSAKDQKIIRQIQNTTKNIQKYCRRSFLHDTRTEFFGSYNRLNSYEPQTIIPREVNFDMSAAFSLWYDELVVDWTTNDPLIINEDYSVDTERSRITLFINTIKRSRSLKLTYTAGYTTSTQAATPNLIDIPGDLRNACAMQSFYSIERQMNKQIGQRKIVTKDKEIDLTVGAQEAFLPEILPTLNSYRSYAQSVF